MPSFSSFSTRVKLFLYNYDSIFSSQSSETRKPKIYSALVLEIDTFWHQNKLSEFSLKTISENLVEKSLVFSTKFEELWMIFLTFHNVCIYPIEKWIQEPKINPGHWLSLSDIKHEQKNYTQRFNFCHSKFSPSSFSKHKHTIIA